MTNNKNGKLYSILSRLDHKIVKCKKELEMECAKLNNVSQTENTDEVQIHRESVEQKRKELLRYENIVVGLRGRINRLECEAIEEEIRSAVSNRVDSLDLSSTTENYQRMVAPSPEQPQRTVGEMVMFDGYGPSCEFSEVKGLEKMIAELKEFEKDPPDSCSAGLVDKDIFHWQGIILGPEVSPYAGGLFLVDLHFSPDYPSRPPKVSFKTKVFHPNIDRYGTIGLDILKEKWSPDLSISRVLLSIFSLLADPNFDDPLVPVIAHMYKTDRVKYETTAQSWTHQYAMG